MFVMLGHEWTFILVGVKYQWWFKWLLHVSWVYRPLFSSVKDYTIYHQKITN